MDISRDLVSVDHSATIFHLLQCNGYVDYDKKFKAEITELINKFTGINFNELPKYKGKHKMTKRG